MATVRKRVSGTTNVATYAVLYRWGGKQSSRTFETEKAAEKFKTLVDLIGADKALATLNVQTVGGLSVDDLFEKWIAWKATTGVTARTLKDYRRDYENWVKPKLGQRVAETVDELDVQAWVDSISGRLDPKSVGDRHVTLSGIYKYGSARSRRLVGHNPCLETQLPSKKKKAPRGFTLAQWDAMHAWGAEHERDADDLLTFIAWTGWRFSEATPLTPAAVEDLGDIEAVVDGRPIVIPNIFVSVLGVHRRGADDRIEFAEGVAKSRAGVRRINLPPEAARVVRRRLVGRGVNDLVFTNPRGNRWHSNNFLEREFQRILDGAEITKVKGMGPHFLRHTHVGMLDRARISASKMQRRIGHENITTTFGVYGGMIDNALTPEELVRLDAVAATRPVTGVIPGEVIKGTVVRELGR